MKVLWQLGPIKTVTYNLWKIKLIPQLIALVFKILRAINVYLKLQRLIVFVSIKNIFKKRLIVFPFETWGIKNVIR